MNMFWVTQNMFMVVGSWSLDGPTGSLAVVLLHALQALQQIVHLVFDLAQLPLDGLQVIQSYCGGRHVRQRRPALLILR